MKECSGSRTSGPSLPQLSALVLSAWSKNDHVDSPPYRQETMRQTAPADIPPAAAHERSATHCAFIVFAVVLNSSSWRVDEASIQRLSLRDCSRDG